MILLRDVHKRYQTDHGLGPWVLKGVTLDIPQNINVGLIGGNGAGKSTLLRLIAGVDHPTKGTVERRCRVSWPMGLGSGFQANLTGRQNAKFICRVLGHFEDMGDRIAFVESFADIGPAFDEQVKNYSSGMKSRLAFALSLAFEFDVYISDEVTAAGDSVFRQKAATAFKRMIHKSGLIMVSHGEGTLRQFCQAGIFLQDGQAHWFDSIDDALQAYHASTRRAMQSAGADLDDDAPKKPRKRNRGAQRPTRGRMAGGKAKSRNKFANRDDAAAGPVRASKAEPLAQDATVPMSDEQKALRKAKRKALRKAKPLAGAVAKPNNPNKTLGRSAPLRKPLQSNQPATGTSTLGRKRK